MALRINEKLEQIHFLEVDSDPVESAGPSRFNHNIMAICSKKAYLGGLRKFLG